MRLPIRKNTRLCDREKNYTAEERFIAYAWVYVGTRIKIERDRRYLGDKDGK